MRFLAGVCEVVVAATAVGLAGLPAGAVPPGGGGSISGRVLDRGGNPVPGICVSVTGGAQAQTDPTGTYSLPGLAAGTYAVQYSDCNPSPRYLTQWYLGRTDQAGADQVSVVDLVDTPLQPVTLDPGVAVHGTVTDTNSNPIPNVNVNVNPVDPGQSAGTQTDGNGNYTTGLLPRGSYRVQFSPTDPRWAGRYWNDKPTWSTADTLTLTAADSPVHNGVDARLPTAATIQGTVTGAANAPVSGICVDANVPNSSNGWDWIGGAQTGADGAYSIGGLPPVDARVHFHECGGGPYVDQWWNNQPDFNRSTPVLLTAGAVTTGVDAQLTSGITVSGTVTDANGAPIPNVTVNVNPTGSGPSANAQTDAGGHYTTGGLPPGDYRVQFGGTGAFAGQFWRGQPSYNNATILTLAAGDAPDHGGIDATLAAAATVSGTVTGPDGRPVGNVCVTATVDSSQGTDWVGNATTAAAGTYTISGLPPTGVKIDFRDCNAVGPYVEQWWNDQPDSSTAQVVDLPPGGTQTGIDARLAAAGEITGTVTNGSGQPLANICVQATTSTFVGGMQGTDSNGHYAIMLSQPGDYEVQFVDCNQPTTGYAGQWYAGQSGPTTARVVPVVPGQVVSGVDAVLSRGATGTISGKILSARGTAMTTACALAYLPTQFVIVGPVQPDGSYTIPNVPSGTYALAFVGCNTGSPQPIVPDPVVAGVSYGARWWNGVPLTIPSANAGPDPIAQGANLVTVTPGADLTGYDACFGCTSITITSITPGPDSLTVAFTTPDLTGSSAGGTSAGGARSAAAPAAPTLTYTVTCTSPNGGVTGSASGSGSPITVTGLTSGASYACQVAAATGGVIVAGSSASGATVAAATTGGTSAVGGTGGADPSSPSGGSGRLPRTGASSPPTLVRAGILLLLLGALLVTTTRRPRRALL